MEPRDYRIDAALPELPLSSPNYSRSLEQWTASLFRQVFSIAFQQSSAGALSYDQSKTFCCQTILKNLARLSQRDSLSASAFSAIDDYIRNSVLPYLQAKYPPYERQEVGSQFNKSIR